jgi:hypothetical protein
MTTEEREIVDRVFTLLNNRENWKIDSSYGTISLDYRKDLYIVVLSTGMSVDSVYIPLEGKDSKHVRNLIDEFKEEKEEQEKERMKEKTTEALQKLKNVR